MAYLKAPTLEEQEAYLYTARRIYRLTKPKSHYIIEYIEDPQDDWFIYVVTITKKTNKFKEYSMIIQKDMCHWVDMDERKGWIKETL